MTRTSGAFFAGVLHRPSIPLAAANPSTSCLIVALRNPTTVVLRIAAIDVPRQESTTTATASLQTD
eukprot:916849-Prymnesium_polylepis.1